MADVIPQSEFDWVGARAKCSSASVFEQLRQGAIANVEQRNAHRRHHDADQRFRFEDGNIPGEQAFTVWDTGAGKRRAADIRLLGDTVRVFLDPSGSEFSGVPTLTDAGECKLLVGEEQLYPWQFLRRALEQLFFG